MFDIPIQYIAPYAASPFNCALAAMIKISDDYEYDNYEGLPCSDKDVEIISEIVTIMGTHNKVSLLLKRNYLYELGAYINHVHPMKFLRSILKNPTLKSYMYGIFDDYFKRNGFMDGVSPSMKLEDSRNNLLQFVDDFTKDMNQEPGSLNKFFKSKDWEGLVKFLIEH